MALRLKIKKGKYYQAFDGNKMVLHLGTLETIVAAVRHKRHCAEEYEQWVREGRQ